jgi:hypothetical protein
MKLADNNIKANSSKSIFSYSPAHSFAIIVVPIYPKYLIEGLTDGKFIVKSILG